MPKTSIEWVISPDGSQGHTVNPIRFRNLETGKIGHHCEKISAGCANCYASAMQKPYLSGLEYRAENRQRGEFIFDESVLDQVRSRRAPTTFFWCDMTDLFGEWVPREWIDRCLSAAASAVRHRHVFLTKRADRMAHYMAEFRRNLAEGFVTRNGVSYEDPKAGVIFSPRRWPLPNVILGVSCEDQAAADERIPYLLAMPAVCRMVSIEPLLGPIGLRGYLPRRMGLSEIPGWALNDGCTDMRTLGLDWVIVGGESGPGARPMHPDWARAVRDQCTAAGVPFFFKQHGEWMPIFTGIDPSRNDPRCRIHDGFTFPRKEGEKIGQHMWRVGKKAAGRELDGRVWDERPEVLR